MEKTGNFFAGQLARLQDGSTCWNFDFEAVYGDFRHGSAFLPFEQAIRGSGDHGPKPGW